MILANMKKTAPTMTLCGGRPKPAKPNKALLALWKPMSLKHRARFAMLADTSLGSLRQYVEGRRGISSELAAQLEKAARLMGVAPIDRTQLNVTCRKCDYAKRCLKGVVK